MPLTRQEHDMEKEKELVELMADKASFGFKNDYSATNMSEELLSVVKSNIGLVAMVCPDCGGVGIDDDNTKCLLCSGSGVVSRTGGENAK